MEIETDNQMPAIHELRNELTTAHMNTTLLVRLLHTSGRVDQVRAGELVRRIDQAHRAMIRVVNDGKPDDQH